MQSRIKARLNVVASTSGSFRSGNANTAVIRLENLVWLVRAPDDTSLMSAKVCGVEIRWTAQAQALRIQIQILKKTQDRDRRTHMREKGRVARLKFNKKLRTEHSPKVQYPNSFLCMVSHAIGIHNFLYTKISTNTFVIQWENCKFYCYNNCS